MASQKSILLLGGSKQQVVAIEAAKRLGYRTVLCDYLPDNPGQYVADVFYQESTTDPELMLSIARKEQVSGVLAYASDPAAPTAAYISEKLGLPGNPLKAVETLSVKHLFREHLAKYGFPCPLSRSFGATSSAVSVIELTEGMKYPVVLKPTDSSGSKGISIIREVDEHEFEAALQHAADFSRNGTLVVEEYIQAVFPRVIGGDVFVANGEVRFWGLMSCLRDERLGGLVPTGERNPSGMSATQEIACKEQIQALVTSLGINCGEFNVEIIIGADDTPYFLELGARAGGNMIPVQLSDISGIDLVEANVRYAMGDNSMDVAFAGNDKACCTYVLHAAQAGIFKNIAISEALTKHVYRTVMYVDKGAQLEVFDGANKALGILFLAFDSAEQMEQALTTIDADITIQYE